MSWPWQHLPELRETIVARWDRPAPFVVLDRRHKPIVCPTLLVLVKVSTAGESSKFASSN